MTSERKTPDSVRFLTSGRAHRMNPPRTLPTHFDPLHHAVTQIMASSIPRSTLDCTVGAYFSRPFTEEEVDGAIAHIRVHGLDSAAGPDGVSYSELLHSPLRDLCAIFQRCIAELVVPQQWVSALIAAVKKPCKDPNLPESYRTIGLESCLLKLLTLLIEH